jgi:hypothetical protein
MTDTTNDQNPMEFFKALWGNMGIPLPGMVTPTVDTDELGRRITDLKAVEGWLKSNLSMLQMTIQGLEMQRATLMAFQAMGQPSEAGKAESTPNAFWPWNFMPVAAENEPDSEPAAEAAPAKPSAPKRKPKR